MYTVNPQKDQNHPRYKYDISSAGLPSVLFLAVQIFKSRESFNKRWMGVVIC